MKYVNSLKYMNSFERAESYSDLSIKRIRELCVSLGRINIGTSSIVIPRGASGHAAAVMLESVIKNAGYKVGRISSVGGYDSRAVVSLDGEIPEIEVYNRANPPEDNIKAEVFAKKHGCAVISGGDTHSTGGFGAAGIILPEIMGSEKRLVEFLKKGDYKLIYDENNKNFGEKLPSRA